MIQKFLKELSHKFFEVSRPAFRLNFIFDKNRNHIIKYEYTNSRIKQLSSQISNTARTTA
ncbi:hypothetical protein LEP1GSC151_5611 [Leptospira interrogans serovar Grippotyphosa str. LT2186]|uniref:Uncharacterized protein n=1 Tax=Leptospira interrogans serovar Grippotyphosa str. LT2186 TaxID=1001599 RepID=M3GPY3_LEPIR|nr:hypothetical protein LEP1GSC151_5611 [Leptospira interrogans serovar Grippotyphosa str. LT2186]